MLKLRFDIPTYSLTECKNHVVRIICKLNSCVIDTETGAVLARLYHSGIASCNPEDHFDAQFGRNLALSRAKLANYENAFDMFVEDAKDSLSAIMFLCNMSINITKEKNHVLYLFGEEDEYIVPDMREFILANVEARLPLLRGEGVNNSPIPYIFSSDLHIG